MAAIRRNILQNQVDAERFVQGAMALKGEPANLRTSDIGISRGPLANERALSTWDLFVIWHVWAMQQLSADGRRNAAHMGPVFLPWHRWYLLVLEFHMRRVLGVGADDFGLPYWDWAGDGGDLHPNQQATTAPIWQIIGGSGTAPLGEIMAGPFTVANGFVVNVEQGPTGTLRATNRGLRRTFGVQTPRLPRSVDVEAALANDSYDVSPWDTSPTAFRNALEGWVPRETAPMLHNQVHVWVGGDMAPGSSPNDPVFFLNHCNVDRLWAQWQHTDAARDYQPGGQSPNPNDPLFRHRRRDPIYSLLTRTAPAVEAMLDVSAFYLYA